MSSRNNGCSFNLQLSEFPKLETETVGVHFDRWNKKCGWALEVYAFLICNNTISCGVEFGVKPLISPTKTNYLASLKITDNVNVSEFSFL